MIHPRKFIDQFVSPSIEDFRTNATSVHKAMSAIMHMDVLAEIVAIWIYARDHKIAPEQQVELPSGKAKKFRDKLNSDALQIIRDAHDSHKHGVLSRRPALISEEQRPEPRTHYAMFAGVMRAGGSYSPYKVIVIELNDGTEMKVIDLLREAQENWAKKLEELSI